MTPEDWKALDKKVRAYEKAWAKSDPRKKPPCDHRFIVIEWKSPHTPFDGDNDIIPMKDLVKSWKATKLMCTNDNCSETREIK